VISTSFADIFRNNAIKNGILPVVVDQNTHTYLVNMVQKNPMSEVVVDLDHQLITLPNGETAEFPIDAFNKECMLEGIDSLEYLLKHQDRIQAYEEVHNV